MWNKKNFGITAATYGLLGLAGAVSFSLPNSLPTINAAPAPAGANTGEQIRLYGVLRDFHKSDTNFLTACSAGNGHYAGNIGLGLGVDDRPTFSGAGFKVASQWKDKDGHQIAPHLVADPYALKLASAPSQDQNTVLDTWDSTKGMYGLLNKGPAPSIQTGSTMPTISAPTNMGPSSGTVFYQNGAPVNSIPVTLNSNIHCQDFTAKQSTTFLITAPITIYCEGDFKPDKLNTFNIMPGGSLTLYVKGKFIINQSTTMNMNTWKPSLLKIFILGNTTMEINQSSKVCAQVVAPNATMHLAQDDHFYGTFTGKSIDMDQSTGFHLDKSIPTDYCSNTLADVAGTKGSNSTGGIPSAARFADWYNDVPGTNASISYPIIFTKSSGGIFECLHDEFHPIDNQVFGNEGDAHNYYFTFMVSMQFTHHACTDGFIEFQGCDDAWLFVNRQLAMDLGGVVPNMLQYVPIDRFSLVDGQVYWIHFFYAQRQPNYSTFKMRTNLDLIGESVPVPVTAMFD